MQWEQSTESILHEHKHVHVGACYEWTCVHQVKISKGCKVLPYNNQLYLQALHLMHSWQAKYSKTEVPTNFLVCYKISAKEC